jgi:hypothetical protein
MVYRIAGIIDHKSEAIEAALVQFDVNGKNWMYEIKASALYPYDEDWKQQLDSAESLPIASFINLHKAYGSLLAKNLLHFIEQHQLDYQVQLIASPGRQFPGSVDFALGDGGTVAALTGINTVSNFTDIDRALGGHNQSFLYEQLLPVLIPEHAQMVNTCFFAVLRWREEINCLAQHTGASRNSIGGAVWIGQEW